MKLKSIHLYSHSGEIRTINFKRNGLNIITGLSSTGKSSIINIIEYCLGRSTCLIAEGIITNNVSWVCVIYSTNEFDLLIAKKIPSLGFSSNSQAMVRKGIDLSPIPFEELVINANDEAIDIILKNILNIPEEKTYVEDHQTRLSFQVNSSHVLYYLFQPQSLIANKDSLLYRQSESSFIAQAIKDSFPILVKAESLEYRAIFEQIKSLKREIILLQKKINIDTQKENLIYTDLLKEAQLNGIQCNEELDPKSLISKIYESIEQLDSEESLNSTTIKIQGEIIKLKKNRQELDLEINLLKKFYDEKNDFEKNQFSLLKKISSINCYKNTNSENTRYIEIIKLVESDLSNLSKIIKKPNNDKTNSENIKLLFNKKIKEIDYSISNLNRDLSIINEIKEVQENQPTNKANLYILIGKIKIYLENIYISDTSSIKEEILKKELKLKRLQNLINDFEAISQKLDSIIFQISVKITEYLKDLNYEHSSSTTRFDFKNLNLFTTTDDGKLIPMNKVGSGANHLALHISFILAIHHYFRNFSCPIPSFLILDQPSQVYFPKLGEDLTLLNNANDDDVNAVKNLFKFLIKFTEEEVKDFQIIMTEHAFFDEKWFQERMVEPFWTSDNALVPRHWISN
ncbi:DUF3732 domain-containing protein [uncultured Acinetobacter sp.]|uniref:DUF3732 domain-containing protein n=1 Tax=uncultured Acinetobacter sp. TaxID=165433 RepID=UPI0025841B1F|nr:DUF3732 domain-containing protein [uncultured Acinetobacter sp.]